MVNKLCSTPAEGNHNNLLENDTCKRTHALPCCQDGNEKCHDGLFSTYLRVKSEVHVTKELCYFSSCFSATAAAAVHPNYLGRAAILVALYSACDQNLLAQACDSIIFDSHPLTLPVTSIIPNDSNAIKITVLFLCVFTFAKTLSSLNIPIYQEMKANLERKRIFGNF